jgi:carboxymethylenebutenolidase
MSAASEHTDRQERHMPDLTLGAVPGGSSRLRAYLAVPRGNGPWPGVVCIHEGWGLDDVMRRQADRLASAGFLTIAPDLYSDGGIGRCIVGTVRGLVSGEGKPIADLDVTRSWLMGRADCTGTIGVIGFCMGGGFALLMAPRGFAAASVNYGTLPRHRDRALAASCPMVASYGRKDLSTRGLAAKLEQTLTRLGVEHDVKEYPGAGHSFLNDAMTGPALLRPLLRVTNFKPDPVAAEDAWARIDEFFRKHLEAAAPGA